MLKKLEGRECQIEKKVKIICPYCGVVFAIPMCQAVNGKTLECPECKQIFVFREK